MKTKLTLFFASVILFAGCDLIKDASTVTISTDLTADIPVVVVGKKSVDQTGDANAVSFTKSQDLTLSSNVDLEPYLSKIKEINLNSLVVTVTGLGSGQTINTITLAVAGVGDIFTQTNITAANNSFTPAIASGVLVQVATKLNTDKKITLTVSGSASGAMQFNVGLTFEAEVIANVLK